MDDVTVELVLNYMRFEEYTQIYVKRQSGHFLVHVGGSPYSSIIVKRYGQCTLLRSFISNNALYLVIA